MSTAAQIQQQNANFKAALDSGKITQAEYDQAMAAQNAKATQPLPVTNWQRTPKPQQPQPEPAPITVWSNREPQISSPLPNAYWDSPTGTPTGYTQVTDPATQTKLEQLSVVAKENQQFVKAKESGAITPAEYNTAIMNQYERARTIEPSIPVGMVPARVQTGSGRVDYAPLEIAHNTSDSGSFFGPTTAYMKDGQMVSQIGVGMKGEAIYEIPAPKDAPKGMNYAENRALTGLTLATSAALPLTAGSARAGAFVAGSGFGGVGVAETAKYSMTGQHLTADEAINAFALGEAGGLGLKSFNSKVVQPKASQYLSRQYEPTLKSGELYQPSVKEQVIMKVTGAKPNTQSLKAQATELLTAKYTANEMVNEKIMFGKETLTTAKGKEVPYWKADIYDEQGVFNFGGMRDYQSPILWKPSAKDVELMNLVGGKVKAPASGIVSGTNVPDGPIGLSGMEAEWGSFQMGVAPKTSLITTSNLPASAKSINPNSYNRMPIIGYKTTPGTDNKVVAINKKETYSDFYSDDIYGAKADLKQVELNAVRREQAIDATYGKKPDNILGADYRGPLGFQKAKLPYGKGKGDYVTFDPLASRSKVGGGSMKPLGGSIGSKPLPKDSFVSESVNQPSLELVKMMSKNTIRFNSSNFGGSVAKTATKQAINPFIQFAGSSYYKQSSRIAEDYEQQYLTMPGQTQRLNQRLTSDSQSLFMGLQAQQTPVFKQSDFTDVFGIQGLKPIQSQPTKLIIGHLPDIKIPTLQKPIPTYPGFNDFPPPLKTSNPKFPALPDGGKFEGSGANMLLGFGGRGSRKVRRIAPVTKPRDLIRRLL